MPRFLVLASLPLASVAVASATPPPAVPSPIVEHLLRDRADRDRLGPAYVANLPTQRLDVDLDGTPDYVIETEHKPTLCVRKVFRSGAGYGFAGAVACCKLVAGAKRKDHLELQCQDGPELETESGVVAWQAHPWGYGHPGQLHAENASAPDEAAQGLAALRAGQYKEARIHLTVALSKGPKTAALELAYAQAARADGDKDGARLALSDALAIDPQYEPALLAKADWLWEDGFASPALLNYKKYLVVAKDPAGIERARRRLDGKEKPPAQRK